MGRTDDEELLGWLRLQLTPGIGDESRRKLLRAFGSAQSIWAAGLAAWREVVGPAPAAALATPSDDALRRAEQALAWRAAAPASRHLLTLGDGAYPPALLHIPDPPCLLYGLGRLDRLRHRSLAVVGSRHATPQGLEHAHDFSWALSEQDLTIVSGLALGIDGAAHEGALKGPGSTVAVVGTGLDRVYPKRHLDLARRLADQGLILSEFALGTPSISSNFPRRNRIIAGLSLGTLVVEAAMQSGSLITARLASEGGREVMAIPGSIHSPQARGCHWLIKQGAQLVETADDVMQSLGLAEGMQSSPRLDFRNEAADAAPAADGPDAEDEVLRALGHDPVTLDGLCGRCGWPVDRLQARLLDLELDGRVVRLPGGLFQRRASA